jgi:hypothetical protein
LLQSCRDRSPTHKDNRSRTILPRGAGEQHIVSTRQAAARGRRALYLIHRLFIEYEQKTMRIVETQPVRQVDESCCPQPLTEPAEDYWNSSRPKAGVASSNLAGGTL